MKKLFIWLTSITTVVPFTTTVIACGNQNELGTDLSKISDYDWNKEEPYYGGYKLNKDLQSVNTEKSFQLDSVESSNYLNYKEFNTGFKTSKDVLKQSPTGIPLNSHFLPNGSMKRDMFLIDKSEYYDHVNSILDWSYETDKDAKYNKSRIELQETTKVASKWSDEQDDRVQEMNMATIIDSTSLENTIVGQKKAYRRGFNNYQYNDITVSWAGAHDEGIIVPPGKNEVEKAHINGTKILGNIFLDGYHGLTLAMLKDFLKKDSSGNYLIVDKLIEIAIELGFDGWFWNNEPNGYQANGTILDYRIVIEILEQWNKKVKSSSDPEVQELMLFTYKNNGNLDLDNNGNQVSPESKELYNNSDKFLADFDITPNDSEKFIEKNNVEEPFNIFNMYNLGGWVNGRIFFDQNRIGTRDTRALVYKHLDANGKPYTNIDQEKKDRNQNRWTYDESKAMNSIAIFASHTPYDLASQDMDALAKSIDPLAKEAYGLTSANYYEEKIYTGKNRNLDKSSDGGSVSYDPSLSTAQMSYGVGNHVLENTLLNDKNESFYTNFSTGNGIKFASINSDNKRYVEESYPWSNTNIGDAQLTYKWMIKKGGSESIASDDLSGYYDYHDPYLKGNSISLGSKYNQKGEIQEAKVEEGSIYDWMIMGSNYTEGESKEVSMVIKDNNQLKESPKILYSVIENDVEQTYEANTTITPLDDGWSRLSATIPQTSATISKFGLRFVPSSNQLKLSLGEFSVNASKIASNQTENIKASSELIIDRNNGVLNYRLNFDKLFDNKTIYDYYEIYFKKDDGLYRIGETNSENYFVKDIPDDAHSFMIKMTNNATKEIEWLEIKL